MDTLINTARETQFAREELRVDIMDASRRSSGNNPYISSRYYLMFCMQGTAELNVNTNTFSIEPGVMNVIAPGSICEASEYSEDYLALLISFSKDFYCKMLVMSNGKFKLIGGAQSHYRYNISCADVLTRYLRGIQPLYNECAENLIGDTLAFHTLCYYNLFLSHNDGDFLKRMAVNTRFGSVVEEFINLVQTYCRREHSVSFYAGELGVTERHLSRQIKVETGKTGKQIIRNVIIREAKALLNSTNMSMAEISDHLGFSDQSAFCKFFLEAVGTTPTGYKKRK